MLGKVVVVKVSLAGQDPKVVLAVGCQLAYVAVDAVCSQPSVRIVVELLGTWVKDAIVLRRVEPKLLVGIFGDAIDGIVLKARGHARLCKPCADAHAVVAVES